jgi:hypothetical protein
MFKTPSVCFSVSKEVIFPGSPFGAAAGVAFVASCFREADQASPVTANGQKVKGFRSELLFFLEISASSISLARFVLQFEPIISSLDSGSPFPEQSVQSPIWF